ncbi:MAG: recombinase family protein [bacterium]|nr:recombinase family protein [bacterium]
MRQSNNKKSRDVTAFLYERLSRDDNLEGESYSIGNQKKLLTKVAKEKGYTNLVHFLDDDISGVTMDRPGFVEMIRQLEEGRAAAVFVKDYCAIIGLNQKDLENQGILA